MDLKFRMKNNRGHEKKYTNIFLKWRRKDLNQEIYQ